MPGVSLGLTLPTVGVTPGTDYATLINTALSTIIADIEAKIVPGEVLTNADWDFSSGGTSYSLTNALRLALTSQASVLGGGNTNSVYSKDGELHFQDGSGNNVQLTSGGSVNNAGAGSINTTGSPAYGSGPEVLWDGGNDEYNFKSDSGATDYANLVFAAAEFRNGSNTMTMATAVTSDYTVTWPAGAAASDNSVLEISTAGQIAFTKTPSVTSLSASGDVTAADHPFTTTRTLHIGACAGIGSSGTSFTSATGTNRSYWNVPSGSTYVVEFSIPAPQGTRITQIYLYSRSTSTSGTVTVRLLSQNEGGVTEIDSTTYTHSAANTDEFEIWNNSDHTMVVDENYLIRMEFDTTGTKRVHGVAIVHDRP